MQNDLNKRSAPEARHAMELERRSVLKLMAGLVAGVATSGGLAGVARAEDGEFVVSNWGGTAQKGLLAAFGDACKAQTGRTLVVDGSGPLAGKIRAMVDAHHATWDVADLDLGNSAQLGAAGLLTPIDYSIVDKSKLLPGLSTEWGIGNYLYSFIFAVNETVANGKIPKTWADFWNVDDFPGKRALPGFSQGVLEAALLADGVDPKKLYPLDVDRACAKIKQLKEHCVFWKSGAQSEDLLRQGEVLANLMWSNRAVVVRRKMPQISWVWHNAILAASGWAVPKDNPAGKDAAMKFLDLSLDPAAQAKIFEIVGMSPTNPAASVLIPKDEQAYNATAFASEQVALEDAWYSKNSDAAEAKYLEAIST